MLEHLLHLENLRNQNDTSWWNVRVMIFNANVAQCNFREWRYRIGLSPFGHNKREVLEVVVKKSSRRQVLCILSISCGTWNTRVTHEGAYLCQEYTHIWMTRVKSWITETCMDLVCKNQNPQMVWTTERGRNSNNGATEDELARC